jgi:acyl-coenzyme A thioesterase PaaI-like protein
VTTLAEVLGARRDGDAVVLMFGPELHGAFGGVFGGVLAAAALHTGRSVVGPRTPAGIDCRFLRPLPAGEARATPTVVYEGRRLSCVRVDVADEQGRLATTAVTSYVDPDELHHLEVAGAPAPAPARRRRWSLPPGVDAPIMAVLDPHLGSLRPGEVAAEVTLPWDEPGAGAAESACVAADLCVGPPVAAACHGGWRPHPNPDLALRLAPSPATGPTLTGIGRVVCIGGGQAVVAVEVHAGGRCFAAGAATSMLLRTERD